MASGVLFAFNAVLNLLLALVLARVLPAAEYGALSVYLAVGMFVAVLAFDWLRLSILRFHTPLTREEDPAIRATLDIGFLLMVPLYILAVIAVMKGFRPEVTLAVGLAIGIYYSGSAAGEYLAVVARTLNKNRAYAFQILIRQALTFLVAVPLAFWSGQAWIALVGLAMAAWPASLYGALATRDPLAKWRLFDLGKVRFFAHYGVPLIMAEALFQAIAVINRLWLAGTEGYAAVGAYALSFELSFKIAAVTASIGEIVLFPRLVARHEALRRSHPESHEEAVADGMSRNVAIMMLALAPVIVGFLIVGRPFAALAVAADLRDPFIALMPYAVAGAACYTILTYVLRPAFQIQVETWPFIVAATAGVLVDVAILALEPKVEAHTVAKAHLLGMTAAMLILLIRILSERLLRMPWLDLAKIAVATGAMAIAALSCHVLPSPILEMAAAVLLGGATYVAFVVGLDVVGLRGLALKELRRLA